MTKAELDQEVAVQIFGTSRLKLKNIPKYSSDISQAMKVFDVMRSQEHRWLVNADTEGYHLRRVDCVVQDADKNEVRYIADKPLGWAKTLDQLAQVICKAALEEIKK